MINFYYTPISSGTTTVKATTKDGNYTESITIDIEKTLVSVNGITLNKNSLELKAGEKLSLIASISPSDSYNKEVYWSSSNNSVVTVNNNGTIKAISKGNAVITVKTEDGGYIATCSVTVTEPQLTATGSIGYKNVVSDSQIAYGVNVTISAIGGTGIYNYYYIKLYMSDGTLIAQTSNTSSNSLFVPNYKNGSYYAEFEIRDSGGAIYNGKTPITTISI